MPAESECRTTTRWRREQLSESCAYSEPFDFPRNDCLEISVKLKESGPVVGSTNGTAITQCLPSSQLTARSVALECIFAVKSLLRTRYADRGWARVALTPVVTVVAIVIMVVAEWRASRPLSKSNAEVAKPGEGWAGCQPPPARQGAPKRLFPLLEAQSWKDWSTFLLDGIESARVEPQGLKDSGSYLFRFDKAGHGARC